jgi:hypothetical protein
MTGAPFPFDLPQAAVSQDYSLAETFDYVEQARPPRPAKPLELNNAPRQRAPLEPLDFRRINGAALAVLPALLRRWLPNGRQRGRVWMALNPRRSDRHAGSFSVNMTTGRWSDFATGDRGDVIALAAFLFNLSQAEAARRLAGMLGISCHG